MVVVWGEKTLGNRPTRDWEKKKKTLLPKKSFYDAASQKYNKKQCRRSCCGVELRAEKKQPCFLYVARCRAAHNQAQSVEQQRRHGRASVYESHVPAGGLGLAGGSMRRLPPLCETHIVNINLLSVVLVYCCWARVNNKNIPTHGIDNRLRVAILHFAETGISTALPTPSWKRAPALLIPHGQVVAVCACS